MASTSDAPGGGQPTFVTKDDEMSLADTMAAQTDESVPDTLEVRSDALSVLQDSTDSMRGPLRMAAMVVGIGLLVIISGGILNRMMRGRSAPPVQ